MSALTARYGKAVQGEHAQFVFTVAGGAGRCVVLSCKGQRTMRTCTEGAAKLGKELLSSGDMAGAKWAFFSCYCLYSPGLLAFAIQAAKQVVYWGGDQGPHSCLACLGFSFVRITKGSRTVFETLPISNHPSSST